MTILRTRPRAARRFVNKFTRLGAASLRRSASRSFEPLETRALLAADGLASDSAWYDSAGTIDLSIRSLLASSTANTTPTQSASAAETTTYDTSFTSVADSSDGSDGDGEPIVSPLADGSEIFSYRLEAEDIGTGDPITSANVGEDFQLAVFVQDLRDPEPTGGGGVFAGFLNVAYDSGLALVDSGAGITYDPFFNLTPTGDLSTPGQIVGAGAATANSSPPGNAEQLLLTVVVHANNPGALTFSSSFDNIPGHDTLLFQLDPVVQDSEIDFGSYEMDILAPEITVSDVTQSEGTDTTTPFVFTVTISGETSATATVAYSTADGTATAGTDYTATSGTLTFAPGESHTQTVTVMVNADDVDEDDEDFTLVLSDPVSAVVGDPGTATIQDDDTQSLVSITGDTSVAEGDVGTTGAVYTVSLSKESGKEITVVYSTANGTATSGSDYTGTSATLTFAPGETQQLVTVPVLGDALSENDETFTVGLSSAVNATIDSTSVITSITDDDPDPTVSIGDVTQDEGDADTTEFVFTVSLSTASGKEITVAYATGDDTANAGSDYTGTSGTLTFAPGQTQQLITVLVTGDTDSELDETFEVNLSNPSNVTLDDATGTGTITNDDGPPVVNVGNVSQDEGDAGTTEFVFTVSLSRASTDEITVVYATDDSADATDGVDYTGTSGTLTFAPGETEQLITVSVLGDELDENDEQFSVVLSNPTNATAGSAGTGTIQDDDPEPSISIAQDTTVPEGDAGSTEVVLTVTLSEASGREVTVEYSTADDTAAAGSDYTGTSGMLTFAPGETQLLITVAVLGDTIDEIDETFNVNLSSAVGATPDVDSVTVTVTDDDDPPSVSVGDVTQDEGDAGTTQFVFTVSLSSESGKEITVEYATNDTGSASDGADYTGTSGTATFAPGVTEQTVTVSVLGDELDEDDETFEVILSTPTNATLDTATGIGTITDDDDPPSVSVSSVTELEGDVGTTDFVFTVSLSSESGKEITVAYATGDDTANEGSDYTGSTGTLTFAPGVTQQFVTVQVSGDTDAEENETFNLDLSDPVNVTVSTEPDQGLGTILNDDGPHVTFDELNVTHDEGDSGTTEFVFTVNINEPDASDSFVTYMIVDGSATAADNDYVPQSGTLTFAAGTTVQMITVVVNGDGSVEDDETFTVQLSDPVNTTLIDSTATGTILNDDFTPSIFFDPADISQSEGDSGTSDMFFTVNLSNASNQIVTVEFDLVSGSATAGQDYLDTAGTLTFSPGTTQQVITVAINGDTLSEADEDFTVRLFNSTNALNATSLGDAETTTGTILDDGDPLPVLTLTPSSQSLAEGGDGEQPEFVYTATLSTASGQTVLVAYQTSDGSATTADGDYVPNSGTLTFAPGETQMLITVLSNGDTIYEAPETFSLNLTPIGNTVTLDGGSAISTLINDDAAPSLSIDSVSVTEGDAGTTELVFTVTLEGDTNLVAQVQFSTADGTAEGGSDFVAQTGTLTFLPGEATQQFITVTVNGDLLNEADEEFTVVLSNPGDAQIAEDTGTGTILNDDELPSISIGDVSQDEGDAGTTAFVFTVSLSAPSGQTVTVEYSTGDGTATQPGDYATKTGTVTFAPDSSVQTITVNVVGDLFQEDDETFFVNLANPSNATIADGQGTGTILNGDDTLVITPSTLSGFAFIDSDNGHDKDAGETTMADLNVTLIGTSSISGAAVNMTTTTAADGSYSFANLDPGTYTITFDQPSSYMAGTAAVGSQGGTLLAGQLGLTATIDSPGGVTGTDNNFFVRGLLPELISQRLFLASSDNGGSVSVSSNSATPTAAALAAPAAATQELFTQNGGVVTVHGTTGDDTFQFSTGAMHTVTINGETRQYDPAEVTDIVFDGAGGDDSAQLTGSSGDETGTFGLGSAWLQGPSYKVVVANVNSITADGGGGNDSATLNDSVYDDALVASGSEATLSNDLGQATTLLAFEYVKAISQNGGIDSAQTSALDFTLEQEGSWVST